MQEIKQEFKSCLMTGFIGFSLALSIAGLANCLSKSNENKIESLHGAEKISKKEVLLKNSKYWILQKDR